MLNNEFIFNDINNLVGYTKKLINGQIVYKELDDDIDLLKRTKVDIADVNELRNDLEVVENDVADLTTEVASEINTLNTRVTACEGAISTLNTTVTNHNTRITSAENAVNTLSTNLTSLTTRVTTAENNISTLSTTTTNHAGRITALETAVTALNSAVSTLNTPQTLSFTWGQNWEAYPSPFTGLNLRVLGRLVILQGLARTPTFTSANICTLPESVRPTAHLVFESICQNTTIVTPPVHRLARVSITSSGSVLLTEYGSEPTAFGVNSWVSINAYWII